VDEIEKVDDGAEYPPLTPPAEAKASKNKALVRKALSIFGQFSSDSSRKMIKYITTTEPKWGTVFRADFIVENGRNINGINRMMCWYKSDKRFVTMFALGQKIVAL
jgi:hypothetical protein